MVITWSTQITDSVINTILEVASSSEQLKTYHTSQVSDHM